MHVRQQIREAVAAALGGLPTSGPRVYVGRVYPMGPDTVPGLTIYTLEEAAEALESMGAGFELGREVVVAVECYAAEAAGVSDVLDTMAAEVETALGAADLLGGIVRQFVGPTSSSFDYAVGTDEAPAAALRLEFSYRYFTTQGEPETAI